MSWKRVLWLALLLPQLGYLLLLAFGQMQLLRMQWQFQTAETFRSNAELLFSPGEFGLEALGAATVLGLGALRRWARAVYTVGAAFVCFSYLFDLNDGPSASRHDWPDNTRFALVVATLVCCYAGGLPFKGRVLPLPAPGREPKSR